MSLKIASLASLGSALLLFLALVLAGGAGAESAASSESAAGPLVVKIHADWCGTCTRMAPSWESAAQQLGGEARFVILDVTDADRVAASAATAKELGIVAFFDANKSKTGTVGVIAAGGDAVAVFKGELDAARVRAAVEKASAGA